MFHLNHMEGVVGPPALLIKLNVAGQPFKMDLKDKNINEENKLVRIPHGGDLAAVKRQGEEGWWVQSCLLGVCRGDRATL